MYTSSSVIEVEPAVFDTPARHPKVVFLLCALLFMSPFAKVRLTCVTGAQNSECADVSLRGSQNAFFLCSRCFVVY